MSSGLDMVSGGGQPSGPGRRRAEKAPGKPWGRRIIVLLVLAALAFGGVKAYGKVQNMLNGPADYTGQGVGDPVVVEIPEGANGQEIATILADSDIVKSAEAFYQLSLRDARAQAIQPGYYSLRPQMSAESALAELSNLDNKVESKVTVVEGARLDQIVAAIAKGSDISKESVEEALNQPDELGLPAEANGNAEGFLYPATYVVPPQTQAVDLLKQMVQKTIDVEKELEIEKRGKAVGLSKTEVMTLASILEYEANRDEDYPKVARVFLNRLDQGIALQSDATVAYANGIVGDVWTTQAERDNPSPYNTYVHRGLPPGPVGAAGEKTIEAVLNPADGDWLYFVPDYENETTVFSNNLRDHEIAAERLRAWCRSSADVDDIC